MTNHDMTGLVSTVNKLVADVKALKLATPHNNASVSRGAFQILSSEGLIVQGSARVNGVERITGEWYLDGVGWVTGTLNIEGILNVSGTSTFSGDSIFSGTLDVTGPSKFTGEVRVEGNMNVVGNAVFDGDVSITKRLMVTAETFLRGKTTVEDDLEVVAGGKLKIGPIEFDPQSHNGYMRWLSGQEILAQSGALEMYSAGAVKYGIQLTPDGVKMPLLPVVEDSGALTSKSWLAIDNVGGKIWRVPNDVGSPLGGDLRWPFDPANITDGFGPRESPGGIGSTFHRGVDWPLPGGTQIPSAGNGTVTFSGGDPGAGFGYHVIIDHGKGIETLYAHQQVPSTLVVGQRVTAGQIVGIVGTTGTSTGDHLHFEVRQDGEQIDPEGFITAPWEPWL